jgi:hypothetical protein
LYLNRAVTHAFRYSAFRPFAAVRSRAPKIAIH